MIRHLTPTADSRAQAECEGCLRLAFSATTHCLTGCAIGEVLGLVLATALGWGDMPSIGLAVALAFLFGYSLTMWPLLRGGVAFRAAIGIALAADTLSIVVMEVVDNAIIIAVPGAMEAGLDELLFWGSLGVALGVAFVPAVALNYYLLSRGRGHALIHRIHESREETATDPEHAHAATHSQHGGEADASQNR
jgi:hypothetical protein